MSTFSLYAGPNYSSCSITEGDPSATKKRDGKRRGDQRTEMRVDLVKLTNTSECTVVTTNFHFLHNFMCATDNSSKLGSGSPGGANVVFAVMLWRVCRKCTLKNILTASFIPFF